MADITYSQSYTLPTESFTKSAIKSMTATVGLDATGKEAYLNVELVLDVKGVEDRISLLYADLKGVTVGTLLENVSPIVEAKQKALGKLK